MAEQEIGKLESHIFPKLKQLLHRYQPQWRRPGGDGGEVAGAELPLLSALSEVVALDLGEPWWKQWWTRRSGEEQVAELDRLIRTEFYRDHRRAGTGGPRPPRSAAGGDLQEANMVYVGLVSLLKEQNNARLDRTRALMSGADPARSVRPCGAREMRGSPSSRRRSPTWSYLVGRLETIEQAWTEKVG